jgi:Cytochrome D1 heme domain/WD domain, G-beta repeat
MRWLLALFVLVAQPLTFSCATVPRTPDHVMQQLRAEPRAYLAGVPAGLRLERMLNREDFVYDAKLSADGRRAAFARLGMRAFVLAVYPLDDVNAKPVEVDLGSIEFDAEALEFSKDGQSVFVVSRDGTLKKIDVRTGSTQRAYLGHEKLSSLAVSDDGRWVVVGSVKGLVSVLSAESLGHAGELRAHSDEVRGLVFAGDHTLLSGSWDKTIQKMSLTKRSEPVRSVRIGFDKKNGQQLFRVTIDAAASIPMVVDERLPMTVLRSNAAASVGLNVSQAVETITLPAATGQQLVKVFRSRTLGFKNMTMSGVDIAVCDACLPPESQGALGSPQLLQLAVATDESTQEMQFSLKANAEVSASMSEAIDLERQQTFSFAASVNDLSIDARRATLGVAFSETKAERNRAVYEREKRNEVEPERPWDCAARVDVRTGKVLSQHYGHRGVVSTVGISPDGMTLSSGGWDKALMLHVGGEIREKFGWSIRRVRFSDDGTRLIVAAWTPQNPLGDHQSDPSAVVYQVEYAHPVLLTR